MGQKLEGLINEIPPPLMRSSHKKKEEGHFCQLLKLHPSLISNILQISKTTGNYSNSIVVLTQSIHSSLAPTYQVYSATRPMCLWKQNSSSVLLGWIPKKGINLPAGNFIFCRKFWFTSTSLPSIQTSCDDVGLFFNRCK